MTDRDPTHRGGCVFAALSIAAAVVLGWATWALGVWRY